MPIFALNAMRTAVVIWTQRVLTGIVVTVDGLGARDGVHGTLQRVDASAIRGTDASGERVPMPLIVHNLPNKAMDAVSAWTLQIRTRILVPFWTNIGVKTCAY